MKSNLVLLIGKDESYLVNTGYDLHTKSGIIKSKGLKGGKFGQKIKTHLGKEFLIVEPTLLDIIERKFKRGAQVILPKDIGLILAYTGIKSNSVVVDAGSGSGYLAVYMANYLSQGKVITYEKDKRFFGIAKENIKISGLGNISIKNKDISKGIREKRVDVITLDLQYPEKIARRVFNSLKMGGWIVVYSPTIEQVIKVQRKLVQLKFSEIKTVENIVREWKTERTTRPKTIGLMHTGWITFARKL